MRGPPFAQQLINIDDSLDSIHGVWRHAGTVPVQILADTPTLVRADLTSSVPFGHHPWTHPLAHLEKNNTLGTDDDNGPSCDEPHE
jgi:hypothetical protein